MTLMELLEEENKDILLAIIPNIRTLIESFCNEHAINKLPDSAQANGETTPPNKGYGLDRSNTLGNKILGGDFSALHSKYQIGK